jgi:hypothetical protein
MLILYQTFNLLDFMVEQYSQYRMSYGTANSHSVGELQILDRQGHPVMLFSQIADPRNVKNLVQAEMKTIQYNVKELK